ncbi:putative RNA methyltransferase [Streptomyces sp. JNUCC 63]
MPTSPNARREARHRLFDVLTCPVCHDRLEPADQALRCPHRHTFDFARHGYAGLLTGKQRPTSGDTASMVQARTAFLRTKHFAPLTHTLAGLAAELCPPGGTVLDAGVGTGYYLAAVLDALPDAAGLGLDTSPHALRRAARVHPRATAAGWDVRRPLPVRSRSVDLVLNVFAPRNSPEFHRVLRPGGALLVVTPESRHLGELQRHLGLLSVDPAKEERLRRTLSARFQRAHTEAVEYVMPLSDQDIEALSSMGRTVYHVNADVLRRRTALLSTTLRRRTSTAPFLPARGAFR